MTRCHQIACHAAPNYWMQERVQHKRQTGTSGRGPDAEREGGWIRRNTWHLLDLSHLNYLNSIISLQMKIFLKFFFTKIHDFLSINRILLHENMKQLKIANTSISTKYVLVLSKLNEYVKII